MILSAHLAKFAKLNTHKLQCGLKINVKTYKLKISTYAVHVASTHMLIYSFTNDCSIRAIGA